MVAAMDNECGYGVDVCGNRRGECDGECSVDGDDSLRKTVFTGGVWGGSDLTPPPGRPPHL